MERSLAPQEVNETAEVANEVNEGSDWSLPN
jgi:hypothetical protein